MMEYQQYLSLWMQSGLNNHTNIVTMQSQGLALSLGLRQISCYMLVSEISFVVYVKSWKWGQGAYRGLLSQEFGWTIIIDESNIIIKAFIQSESKYKLQYTKFIGDGNSSVYPSLITEVLQYGHAIRKVECQSCCQVLQECTGEASARKTPLKHKGGITSMMRKCLTKVARCAIKIRSENSNCLQALKLHVVMSIAFHLRKI